MQDLTLTTQTDLPEESTTIQTWNYCGHTIQCLIIGDDEVIVHEGIHYVNPVWEAPDLPTWLHRFAELVANDSYDDESLRGSDAPSAEQRHQRRHWSRASPRTRSPWSDR